MSNGFIPPKPVAEEAAKGLKYREMAGGKGRLTPEQASKKGIGSGVQRAIRVKKILEKQIKKSCISNHIKKIANNLIIAVKLRIKPPKRRTPTERLKARLYYRKNRAKIRTQRRRYLRTHKSILKHRKMFMRYKPKWFKHPKPPTHIKPKKVKAPKRK